MILSDKLRAFSLFYRRNYLAHGDWLELIGEAERLEAQNARLRELVQEAYNEGYIEGDVGDWTDAWEQSEAKAELDEMDKEGSDA